MAHEHTLAVCRMIAAATIEIANEAETSVSYTAQIVERVAASTGAFCASASHLRRSKPAEIRSAFLYARQANRRANTVADQVEKVREAADTARSACWEIYRYANTSHPKVNEIRDVMDNAIQAAARAEREARIARAHLWESAVAAL